MSARRWCRGCSIAAPRAPEPCGLFLTARRRQPGEAILAGDKPVGTMGSSAGGAGLALIRIDRAADALDAGTPLTSGGLAHPPCRAGRRPIRTEADRGMTRSARLHADGLTRCPWPGEDPFYMAYHDTEWGVPEYDDRALYEKLMLDGFQAGLSWITILRKRDNFRRAFDDFRPEKIARYNAKKVHALMNDAGIVRNRAKIEGTINSAKSYLEDHGRRPGLFEIPVGFRRRQAEGQPFQDHRQRAGLDAALDQDFKGTGRARLQIRRPDHRLRVHAGHRHGQRPSGDLLLPRKPAAENIARRASRSNDGPRKLSAPKTSSRVWQRMLSGRRLDLLDPSPLDIEIADIAHGLARVARWNGQTSGAHIFSVAQHTLLVEAVMREQTPRVDIGFRLAALLHDAPEYVIGDM